ncbi:LPS biosynthesis protein [Actinomycetota bacterium]|nr:LPS biosynthesis protein [Actinomycetota bacterium]
MTSILADDNNRLAIYCIYDRDGIVEDYITLMLDELQKNVKDIYIVVNGSLTDDSKSKVEKLGDVHFRENVGLDSQAYKEAMLDIGWEKLQEYDEILHINDTLVGPIYPFSETFQKMDAQDLDFWGLTKYHEHRDDRSTPYKLGYLPEHINTSFMAWRKSIVQSVEFQNYWNNLPVFESYWDITNEHETQLTKHFSDLGFVYSVSVDSDKIMGSGNKYPLLEKPVECIRDLNCPVFKKRVLFNDRDSFLAITGGEGPTLLLDYIKQETNYPLDAFIPGVIRNANLYNIQKNMGLLKVLPRSVSTNLQQNSQRLALIIHSYFPDLVDYIFNYARSIPNYADVYITVPNEEQAKKVREVFTKLDCSKLEVRVVQNRGRSESALLVGVKDVVMDYDLACFVHDKKTPQLMFETAGESFSYRCFENLLGAKEYVENVISEFEKDKFLGIAFPTQPIHSEFLPQLDAKTFWGGSFDITQELLKKLGAKADLKENVPLVAPIGGMFWFRPAALKKLYGNNWDYSDFPKEPIDTDATLLHAIERSYAYFAQDAGYYMSYLFTDEFYAIDYAQMQNVLFETFEQFFKIGMPAAPEWVQYEHLKGWLVDKDYYSDERVARRDKINKHREFFDMIWQRRVTRVPYRVFRKIFRTVKSARGRQ